MQNHRTLSSEVGTFSREENASVHWTLSLRLIVAACALTAALAAAAVTPAFAQDVRGLEVCTAEKQMERRTGCLQSNVEFLQSVIERNARDARLKLDAATKDLAAARTEINTLKAVLAATQARLDKLEKPEPKKPDAK